jgi:hypothetical protein
MSIPEARKRAEELSAEEFTARELGGDALVASEVVVADDKAEVQEQVDALLESMPRVDVLVLQKFRHWDGKINDMNDGKYKFSDAMYNIALAERSEYKGKLSDKAKQVIALQENRG